MLEKEEHIVEKYTWGNLDKAIFQIRRLVGLEPKETPCSCNNCMHSAVNEINTWTDFAQQKEPGKEGYYVGVKENGELYIGYSDNLNEP